jgi:hypothetical protein
MAMAENIQSLREGNLYLSRRAFLISYVHVPIELLFTLEVLGFNPHFSTLLLMFDAQFA